MAGRKQHFIPQSLQRGFAAKHTGVKTQVYVFPKNAPAYLTSTEGVGAERDFYSKPNKDGLIGLDDQITAFELYELNDRLEYLRSQDLGSVESEKAAIVVVHLTARAAHLRGAVTSIFNSAFLQMRTIISDVTVARDFAGIDSINTKSTITTVIGEELSRLGAGTLSEKDHAIIERIVAFRLRERFDDLYPQYQDHLTTLLSESEIRIPESVANGHTKFLSDCLVPEERVKSLCAMSWRIESLPTEDFNFILPDCVALAFNNQEEKFEPFSLVASESIAAVVMPISSKQILIGGSINIKILDINEQFAKNSFRFFISSRQDEHMIQLSKRIGEFMSGLNADLLEGGLEPNVRPTSIPTRIDCIPIRTPTGKFGNNVRKAISKIANKKLDSSITGVIDLISIPSNLDTALNSLLNRQPTAIELNNAYLGVTKPIKVGKQWKCQIIVPRKIAENLVDDSLLEQRLWSRRVVSMAFGRANYIGCWISQFPKIFEIEHIPHWAQAMLNLSFNTASHYFAALNSIDNDCGAANKNSSFQQIAKSIELGANGLTYARRQFFEHRNIDALANEVIIHLDVLMGAVASFCGFAGIKRSEINENSESMIALINFGLWDWAMLFSKDLAGHYERRRSWHSEKELEFFVTHAERLLWTIGVFVTPTAEGHWIDVCDDEKLNHVIQLLRQ